MISYILYFVSIPSN